MKDYFDVRYTKLYFTVMFTEDTELVRKKASAIRGGMGEMLLRSHCVSDRNCEKCSFESECLVQQMMYSKFENRPAFMSKGDSVGYIISCENTKTNFASGDYLEFSLTLFGKNIAFFSNYLNAFYALGVNGLGVNKSKFQIIKVENMFREELLVGNDIFMSKYKWQTIGDYVDYRRSRVVKGGVNESYTIEFSSPLELKYDNKFITELSSNSLKAAILRRLYILACFENKNVDKPYEPITESPMIVEQDFRRQEVYRYSSRKNQKMKLQGIIGSATLLDVSDEWLDLLIAGEIIQLGKNTSFGFGKYKVI